ncbi:MAG: aminotransferase class I/II-fold pyridoxal phosphate-dependent enzyme, partial [Deltaproteobacteria bacterium]|nr:aminotransferase class I/II-fold pyridoxal phosphate-dependent enzyme [Deltaproteobacteria bacterium]
VIEKYHAKFGVRLSTNQVLTSSGSSPLLFLAIRMLVEQDMELIITDPCYSCYENLAKIAGVKTIRIPLRLEDGFQLDIDCLKKHITKKTRAILINSPMNPTGITLSDESFRNLAALGIPIISDEIYGDLIYEGKPRSILNFTDNAIVVNGLSKYYAMTGWRLGYMILPENWVAVASRIHQNLMISAAHFIQIAGTAALRSAEKECDANRLKLNAKRLFLIRRLKECGLDPGYLPTGAFYVFFRYPNQQMTSLDTAIDILEKQGVALTPGIDFGPAGEGFLRFSYSNSMENISEAVNRIQRYFFP